MTLAETADGGSVIQLYNSRVHPQVTNVQNFYQNLSFDEKTNAGQTPLIPVIHGALNAAYEKHLSEWKSPMQLTRKLKASPQF